MGNNSRFSQRSRVYVASVLSDEKCIREILLYILMIGGGYRGERQRSAVERDGVRGPALARSAVFLLQSTVVVRAAQ